MKRQLLIKLVMILLSFAALSTQTPAAEPPRTDSKVVPRMSKEDLKAKLGQKNVMVIDVRLPDQIVPGTPKIRGAAVENPSEVLDWMHKYPKNKTLVFYCA